MYTCSTEDEDSCTSGALCDPSDDYCTNVNPGGGCGGPGLDRVIVGAFLGGYIILYGQVQSWTPQLVTGPLNQTPPNKLTEVFWGMLNCYPTMIATVVVYASEVFREYHLESMIAWLVIIIVSFAVIFAINSSIHSFLVVKYAKSDTVAKSVGFYYMSNALGRLMGTLGSGYIYTYAGGDVENVPGYSAGSDARIGLAACFLAGTLSSLLAAVITIWIKDDDTGFKCRNWTIIEPKEQEKEEPKQEESTTAAIPALGSGEKSEIQAQV